MCLLLDFISDSSIDRVSPANDLAYSAALAPAPAPAQAAGRSTFTDDDDDAIFLTTTWWAGRRRTTAVLQWRRASLVDMMK
jgi:hypothetical protein